MKLLKEKELLRREVLNKIKGLSPDYMESSSKEICKKVMESKEYKEARTVFTFVGRPWEIDTLPIIEDALEKGKILCVPKCISKGIMEARQITDLSQLEERKLGLLEPGDSSPLIKPHDIEFTLVPCLTCDLSGRRLGFGGGFYDRYLKDAPFVSYMVCREALISPKVPIAPYDIIPHGLITEKRMLFFK
ncbi:MAG: 5-formyltetrahydrofolate cyclo-ligase [Anaerovoracaceae bacterium]